MKKTELVRAPVQSDRYESPTEESMSRAMQLVVSLKECPLKVRFSMSSGKLNGSSSK